MTEQELLEEGLGELLSKAVGTKNVELIKQIGAFMKQTATLDKDKRNASLKDISTSFTEIVNRERAIIADGLENFSDPKKAAAAAKAMNRLAADLIRLLGMGAFVAVPIPGTGPMLIVVLHRIFEKLSGGRIGLIPDSTYEMFQKWHMMNQAKPGPTSFKEFYYG